MLWTSDCDQLRAELARTVVHGLLPVNGRVRPVVLTRLCPLSRREQSSFFFGYMGLVSYAFFIMLGYVGFASSMTFVKYIYGVLKCD